MVFLVGCMALLAQNPKRERVIPDSRAEVMYYNGKIITMWPERPIAEAVTIAEGRILAVGTTQQVGRTTGPKTKQINLHGRTMVPGLIETHVHPINAGLAERDFEIPIMRSFAEIQAHVEKLVASSPAEKLIFVPKVYSTRLKERRYPTRWQLDKFSGKHMVMLDNNYAAALNSAALRAIGIDRDTPEPDNGKIIRDPKTGEPTGLILGARQLVSKLVATLEYSDEDRVNSLRKMHKAYNAVGITSVIDRALWFDQVRIYQKLWAEDDLTVRTNITVRLNGERPFEEVREDVINLGLTTGFGDDYVRIGALKLLLDGGILIGTAYLRAPYGSHTEVYGFDDPDYRGVLRIPRERILAIMKLGHRLGWQMTAHTTGGASTDVLLDVYDQINRESPIRDRRFSLTHSNFHNAESIAKAKRLGVLLDLQPAWYHFDGPAISEVLGRERMKTFQPYKSLHDAGLIVVGGSDHMIKFDARTAINPYHPFFGMWMVITRKTTDGTVFSPEERISREQALKMWTWNGAYLTFDEEVKGSIEPGKFADLAVISRDYLTCPVDEIKDIEALATIVGGKVVYERGNVFGAPGE